MPKPDGLPVLPADRNAVIGRAATETEALLVFADWYNDKTPPHLDSLACEIVTLTAADIDEHASHAMIGAVAGGRAYRVGFHDQL